MEQQIIYFIQNFRNPILDNIMSFITDSYLIVIPFVILFLYLKKNKKVFSLIISLVLVVVSVTILKTMILEQRPCAELQINSLGCEEPLNSFPSRHSAIVFDVLSFLTFSPLSFALYFIYAILVGFSRIYLGQHYPHDVIAGAILGLAIGYACLTVKKKNFSKIIR